MSRAFAGWAAIPPLIPHRAPPPRGPAGAHPAAALPTPRLAKPGAHPAVHVNGTLADAANRLSEAEWKPERGTAREAPRDAAVALLACPLRHSLPRHHPPRHAGCLVAPGTAGLSPPTLLSSGLTDIPKASSVIRFKFLRKCQLLNEAHLLFFNRTCHLLTLY